MTISSGFFNSINHDRLYDAEQLSSIFDGIIIDGVYENYGDAFMITANPEANSSVLVGTGRAWFDHTWIVNDSTYAMQLDPPNEMLGRIDAIVIDIDRRTDIRKNSIIYIKGSESTPNQPPTLIKEDLHNQYPLAYITRIAGSDSPISQVNIDYQVGTTGDCPIVTSVLEAQNLEQIWAQLDAEFDEWWDGIKATLDENIVTNLQNQINELKEKIEGDDALVGLLTKPVYEAFKSGDYGLSSHSFTSKASVSDSNAYGICEDSYCGAFILPEGGVLHAYVSLTGGYEKLTVDILNSDGVKTTKTSEQYSVQAAGVHAFGQSFFMLSNVDSYPITFGIVAMTIPDYKSNRGCTGDLFTATITSSKNVSFTHQSYPFYDYVGSGDTGQSNPETCISGHGAKLPSGQFITCSGRTNNIAIVYSVSSDSVITSKGSNTFSNASNIFGFPSRSADRILETKLMEDGTVVVVPGYSEAEVNYYAIIDPYTLNMTIKSIGDTYTKEELIPNFYAINSVLNKYEAYEETGLVKKITSDYSNSEETEQISDYFIGASNANISIPEGTIVGIPTDDGIFGVASSGNYIGVGKNGGAAILNSKGTSNLPDENKRLLWICGYRELNNKICNLYLSGNPTYSKEYWKREQTALTVYYVEISKE